MQEITFSVKKDDEVQEFTVQYNYGDTLQEAIELFGEEAVYSLYAAKADIWVQDFARARMKAGDSLESIQAKLDARKIGVVTRTKKDPVQTFLTNFAKMSDAQKAGLLEQMKAAFGQ
jgi:hypothetical protein